MSKINKASAALQSVGFKPRDIDKIESFAARQNVNIYRLLYRALAFYQRCIEPLPIEWGKMPDLTGEQVREGESIKTGEIMATCPSCNKPAKQREENFTFDYGDESQGKPLIEVQCVQTVYSCDDCQDAWTDHEAETVRTQAIINAMYREIIELHKQLDECDGAWLKMGKS